MNSRELRQFIRNNPSLQKFKFGGVIAKNHLPAKSEGKFFIINTQNCTQPGNHWTAIWTDTKHRVCEYFDPIGQDAQPDVKLKLFEYGGGEYVYNRKRIQRQGSILCGQFCLFFLYHKSKNKSMKHILNLFKNKNADSVVKTFYLKMK